MQWACGSVVPVPVPVAVVVPVAREVAAQLMRCLCRSAEVEERLAKSEAAQSLGRSAHA